MSPKTTNFRAPQRPLHYGGFTLVELVVAMAVVILLLLLLSGMTDQARDTLQQTSSRIQAFREARQGFEAVTRRLSQATLNTYWDYDNPNQPTQYQRQSELRFICGEAQDLIGGARPGQHPGQAVFFQAPLGKADASAYQYLGNLLNTWGYFVEYDSDQNLRPAFRLRH